jgi:hypothetical protein
MGWLLKKPYKGLSRLASDLPLQLQHRPSRPGDPSGIRWLSGGRWCASNQRDRSRNGEVETSQAEPDLTALEGFLVGNQDLERLDTLLDHFNFFWATGRYWDGHEDEGCQGIQDPQRIEQGGELYHKQEEKAR